MDTCLRYSTGELQRIAFTYDCNESVIVVLRFVCSYLIVPALPHHLLGNQRQ